MKSKEPRKNKEIQGNTMENKENQGNPMKNN